MMKWIVLGIAIIVGFIFLKIWLLRSQSKDSAKRLFDVAVNSVFWGFLIWKGSLLVLEPKLVVESPMSLLYFTGGNKGLILGILGAIIYFLFKARKLKVPNITILQSTLVFIFAVMSVYFVVNLVLTDRDPKVHTVSTMQAGKIGLEEGNIAPDFQLMAIDGTSIKLSDMQGKKVILNFWATWCPPCKAEIPHMQDFYAAADKNKFELLAINLTSSEKNTQTVKRFVKERKLTFPVLLDQDGEVGSRFQAITIPTSYVIDSKGIVRKKIVGPMDKDMMNQLIEHVD